MPKQVKKRTTLDNNQWRVQLILSAILLLTLTACDVLIGTIEVGIEEEGVSSLPEGPPTQVTENESITALKIATTSTSSTEIPLSTESPTLEGDSVLNGLVYAQEDFLWKISTDGEAAPFFENRHHNAVVLSSDGLYAIIPGEGGFWIADIQSGERHQLTDNPDRFHFSPQWWTGIPGAILLLSKPRIPDTPMQPTGPGNLTLVNADGSGYQVLDSEFKTIVQPSPSPDGLSIAYVRGGEDSSEDETSSPWLYRLDSGPEPFDYTAYGLPEFEDLSFGIPAFSPDGRYLAWAIGGGLSGDGTWQVGIALFDIESIEVEVLLAYTPGDEIISGDRAHRFDAPRWDAKSQHLAWSGFPIDSKPGFWISHRGGSDARFVQNAFTPLWSPDGRRVAYMQGEEPPKIRVMEVASGEIRDTGIPAGPILMDWVSNLFALPANVPEGVWACPGACGPIDNEFLVQQSGQLSPEEVPVQMELVWQYSSTSGRLAYSSQFFHWSSDNRSSVTDLWVYDYKTGQAEQWLEDNLSWASWRPPVEGITVSDRLTAAIYDPEVGHIILAFLDGPDEIEIIAECASTSYSWSPDNKELAYINITNQEGVSETCTGTFIYSAQRSSTWRVSDFGDDELSSHVFDDAPIWAVEDGVLLYPDSPFWVVPLDGSPPFVPEAADGEEPMNLPRMQQHLWAPELNLLIGNVEGMTDDFSGVWVFELSDDFRTIITRYRIEDRSDLSDGYRLLGWWEPGESLLMLTAPNEFSWWGSPVEWSLAEQKSEFLR